MAGSGRPGSRGSFPLLLALAGTLALAAAAHGQPYGLGAPSPVAPFANGVFPTLAPNDPTHQQWSVAPAFPNVTFDFVTAIASAPNDRLYVASRGGAIFSIDASDPATAVKEPFLDLTDRVATVYDGGFLGLAFHPDFGQPGAPHRNDVFVYYTSHCPLDATREAIDLSACTDYPTGDTDGFFGTWLRLSRYQVPDGSLAADPASEQILLNIRLYNGSHRGGGITFGTDGYLYLSIGDQYRYETAQDIADTLEGGVIRLDVDVTEGGGGSWTCGAGSHLPVRRFDGGATVGEADEMSGQSYCIPDTNPFPSPGGATFEEYASLGHRAPHRLTTDTGTGLLWMGEVGLNSREEVNVIELGGNYGWPFREGTIAGPRPAPPSIVGNLTEPIIDFVRDDFSTIIGGYVYRGSEHPELVGRYLCGDWQTDVLYAITYDPVSGAVESQQIGTFTPGFLTTWGQDQQGEVYMGRLVPGSPLYKLAAAGPPIPDPPALLSQLGVFSDVASLTPAPFMIPYDLNVPFWSDGAGKWRWVILPNDGSFDMPDEQVAFSAADDWDWPIGTVFVKHFELLLDESDPASSHRLETRFQVLSQAGTFYGLTYRWLPDGSDAQLLTDGETETYTIQTATGTRDQTWLFPSRTQCRVCHSSAPGALGPRTQGLNRALDYPSTGITDNQLRTWNHLGIFSPALVEAAIPTLPQAAPPQDPTASLEDRARGWLDANCSYCHRPDTGNRAAFDARLSTPLEQQNLVWGDVLEDFGLPGAVVIHPGDRLASIAYLRAGTPSGTGIGMPPLAKSRVDPVGFELLGAWIDRVEAPDPRHGVRYEYFEGDWTLLPDFDALTPVATGVATFFDISVRQQDDFFAFRFTSWIEIEQAADYTFSTVSNDGSRLFVDGVQVVDADGLNNRSGSGSIFLAPGRHELVVTMFERTGGHRLDVYWEAASLGLAKQVIPGSVLYRSDLMPIPNQPPVLGALPGPASVEGEFATLTLSASDPELDALWWSAAGLPPGLSLDRETGTISGVLAAGAAGSHPVTVGVSDGPGADDGAFTWTVLPSAPGVPGIGASGAGALATALAIGAWLAIRRRRGERRRAR